MPIASPLKKSSDSAPSLSPQEAAAALRLWAATSRAHLDIYGQWVHGYTPEPHIQAWVELVTALWRGELTHDDGRPARRLALVAPPGTAKSQWLSVIGIAWYLGNHPDRALIFLTNSDTPLARETSRSIEATLHDSDRHRLAFPSPAARPDEARGWSLDGYFLKGRPGNQKDASFRSMGYGARILGARVDGIILDDPLDQKQSQSAAVVADAIQYHNQTVSNRLKPDGWELALLNRWADGDLVGHFKQNPAWVVAEFPMETPDDPYEWGPYLWPSQFTPDWCAEKRREIGGPLYACTYLLDPTSMGGDIFKHASWLRPLPADFSTPRGDGAPSLRDTLTIVQAWDIAFSDKETACWTVCLTLGLDRARNLYVLSVLRRKIASDPRSQDPAGKANLVDALVEQIELYRPHSVVIEEGAFQTAFVSDLVQQVNQRAVANVATRKPKGDKVTRARLPAARAEAGMLYADRDAPWFADFEHEVLAFPQGEKDQVDALSLATEAAAELNPDPEAYKPRVKADPWGRATAFGDMPGLRK